MSEIPFDVRRYLYKQYTESVIFSYVLESKIDSKLEWTENINALYGIELVQDVPIDEQLLFLQGLYPYQEKEPFILYEVVFSTQRAANIHIVPSKYKLCILIFDVTQAVLSHQKIQQQQNELKLLYEQEKRSIRLLNAAYQEMQRQKQCAEEKNRAKSELLRHVTHDLKSPLTGILGFAELLEVINQPLSNEAVEYVNEIKNSGHYLLSLINDLLDSSKNEAKNIRVSLELLNVYDFIGDSINALKPIANANSLDFFYRIDSNLPAILIDPLRFRQILINFISNAIKYNKNNGCIIINSYVTHSHAIRINIKDTGCGISPENQYKIFQEFERGGAENTDVEGNGIGLSVCKQFAELMNGSVGVYSEVGIGSLFWLEIPISEAQLFGITPPLVTQNILSISDNELHFHLIEAVVEQRMDTHLFQAHNMTSVKEIMEAQKISAILLDMNYLTVDIWDFFEELQAYQKKIPIIAIFNSDVKLADIKKALNLGFYDYLHQPIDFYVTMDLFDRLAAVF